MTVTRFESMSTRVARPRWQREVHTPADEARLDPDHKPLLRAALSSTVFAIVALVILRPRFESNDDVVMMWLADGTALGEPSPYLMFTNILIGRLLSWLYTTWAAVSWYPLYLTALLWSSLTAQLYLLNAFRPKGAQAQLAYGTVFTVNLLAWLNMQFTSVASLLGLAGVALVCFAPAKAETDEPRTRVRQEHVVGGVGAAMVGISSLVRFESLLLVAVISAPIVLSCLRGLDRQRLMVFGLVAVAIVGAGMLSAREVQQSPDWAEYMEWNKARGLLHDTPRLLDPAAEADLLDEIGWSVNDATLFKEWLFIDQETFDFESVDRLGQSLEPDQSPVRIVRRMASSALAALPVILAATLAVLDCISNGARRQRILCGATAAISGLVLSSLVLVAKIPMRITVPIFAWFVLVAVITAPRRADNRVSRSFTLGNASVALAVVTVLSSALLWGPASEDESAVVDRALSSLERHDPDGTFVIWGGPIHYEYGHPFDLGSRPRVQLLFTGWVDRSPMQRELLDRLELNDLTSAIAQRSDVHLVMTDELERPEELFVTYLNEHDVEGSVSVVADIEAVRVLGCGDRCSE